MDSSLLPRNTLKQQLMPVDIHSYLIACTLQPANQLFKNASGKMRSLIWVLVPSSDQNQNSFIQLAGPGKITVQIW